MPTLKSSQTGTHSDVIARGLMGRTGLRYRIIAVVAIALALLPGAAHARTGEHEASPGRASACSGWIGWTIALWPAMLMPCRQAEQAASAAPVDLQVPAAGIARQYIIHEGDSLWDISLHYGVSPNAITRANGLGDDPILSEGMDLLIPYSNEAGAARYGADGRPVVNGRGPHFVASIARQTCWLFQDTSIVRTWQCSTGRPSSPSAPGNYTIQSKIERAFNIAADSWMPYWLGLYDVGDTENGIHGMPYSANDPNDKAWIDMVGTPITFGCIMLADKDAIPLYNLAYIGMPVTILP
jgi:hypothetical protein